MYHQISTIIQANPWLVAYFNRIKLPINSIHAPGSRELLSSICESHVRHIPFENLSIFLEGKVSLDPEHLKDKLITQKRGGWCFEQNGILSLVLESLGYRLRSLMARSLLATDRPRTHQVLLVEVHTKLYLCDVGFGGIVLRQPLELKSGTKVIQDGLPFRIEERQVQNQLAEPSSWVLQAMTEAGWKDLYRFTLETATPADFAVGNHYHVSSTHSSFPGARIITMPVPGGRATLTDRRFRLYKNGLAGEELVQEREIDSITAYKEVLAETFGLYFQQDEATRLFNLDPARTLVDSGS